MWLRMTLRSSRRTSSFAIVSVRSSSSFLYFSEVDVSFRILGAGRLQVGKSLLGMLPAELSAISDPEERATEYLHYRQFFNVWETLDRVVECQALEVSGMSSDERRTWSDDYKASVFLGVL